MDKLVLDKNELLNILKPLTKSYEIIGPVEEDENIYFRPVDCIDDVIWEFDNAVNSIKEFFFPQRQILYEVKRSGVISVEAGSEKKRVLLFARPCDVRAVTILDKLFISDYEDRAYTSSRKNTIIVGLSCLKPREGCFCLSIGGNPFGIEGMDVSIAVIDEGKFLTSIVTNRAKDILEGKGIKAQKEELQKAERLKKKAEQSIKREIHIPQDLLKAFESDYWKDISWACLKCGVCTYLCPTCHCFDIVDEGFFRVRCWDTCSSDTFTRMASGEDPRKNKFKRYRQRIYHKFSYYKQNFDEYACVGCGRCTEYCPVKTDVVEIINNINEKVLL
ncbi:MAG: 4Fe-4S dicluster domain-containing protein [Spirochaetota bacterium]|nr:MAG: 4Fe-4S dicluster domain-containing protein [Spirochaetota bacterium]